MTRIAYPGGDVTVTGVGIQRVIIEEPTLVVVGAVGTGGSLTTGAVLVGDSVKDITDGEIGSDGDLHEFFDNLGTADFHRIYVVASTVVGTAETADLVESALSVVDSGAIKERPNFIVYAGMLNDHSIATKMQTVADHRESRCITFAGTAVANAKAWTGNSSRVMAIYGPHNTLTNTAAQSPLGNVIGTYCRLANEDGFHHDLVLRKADHVAKLEDANALYEGDLTDLEALHKLGIMSLFYDSADEVLMNGGGFDYGASGDIDPREYFTVAIISDIAQEKLHLAVKSSLVGQQFTDGFGIKTLNKALSDLKSKGEIVNVTTVAKEVVEPGVRYFETTIEVPLAGRTVLVKLVVKAV